MRIFAGRLANERRTRISKPISNVFMVQTNSNCSCLHSRAWNHSSRSQGWLPSIRIRSVNLYSLVTYSSLPMMRSKFATWVSLLLSRLTTGRRLQEQKQILVLHYTWRLSRWPNQFCSVFFSLFIACVLFSLGLLIFSEFLEVHIKSGCFLARPDSSGTMRYYGWKTARRRSCFVEFYFEMRRLQIFANYRLGKENAVLNKQPETVSWILFYFVFIFYFFVAGSICFVANANRSQQATDQRRNSEALFSVLDFFRADKTVFCLKFSTWYEVCHDSHTRLTHFERPLSILPVSNIRARRGAKRETFSPPFFPAPGESIAY